MSGFAKLWFRWPHLPTPEHHLMKSSNNPNPGHRKFPPSTPTCQVYGPGQSLVQSSLHTIARYHILRDVFLNPGVVLSPGLSFHGTL